MTNQQIKALEKELWATADNLRAFKSQLQTNS